MLRCNLAILLAERGLKMTDVFRATKIGLANLRALYHNRGAGVQYGTIDKLCAFLHVTPGELYTFCDFSYDIMEVVPDNDKLQATVFVQVEAQPLKSHASVTWTTNDAQLRVHITYDKALYALLSTIPTAFRQVLDSDLARRVPLDVSAYTLHIRVTSA